MLTQTSILHAVSLAGSPCSGFPQEPSAAERHPYLWVQGHKDQREALLHMALTRTVQAG